jgi:predicted PurR-regulated permease PerM
MNYLKTLLDMDLLGQFVSRSVRTGMNIVFGLFISFYALLSKEKLVAASKRFIYAVFPRKISGDMLSVFHDADVNFSKFIIGKGFESVLVGLISLAAYLIFDLPVPVFLAIVAGIMNMVPIFGPIFGSIVTGIILLGFGPMQMLTGVLICIAVQALDNAALSPKILGDACGLSPLMIIVSITIGGDLFGLLGILLAVPVVGTLKHTVVARIIEYRLSTRGIDPDNPDNPGELDGQREIKE